ncbi:ABC transporter substrate-binding protein [Cohaesibacter gelatinilyticus]|uniref:Iron complex transport system substrate-binding protein n=1 Tax=Cohaesibacter gelatinilyticus TaxID=372072 RepID=A0A285NJY2_9HYPH|nr:ABC transporter substrate-binding protein [Cohaesibacter gelatinilyticus]SNZ07951.1 iron complex transport system substrate-binding protein [Cohaesibacter gelatinilyticus]
MKNNSLFHLVAKAAIIVGLVAGLGSTSALAEKITVTDIAGRSVSLEKNPSKIVLGEGRMIYSIALLDRKNPFERVVGWKDDLIRFDPDHYRKYKAKFPAVDKIKNFGSPYSSEFSLEAVVASGAEVMILNLGKLLQAQESGLLEKLEKAGVAVLFVDFRQRPTQNTVPSLQLLGRVLDRREQADEFIDFYIQNMQTVLNRVEKIKESDRPVVFVERAAGYNPDKCCSTFGDANLGRLVDLAGGANWGSKKFSGHGGKVNPEAIFVDDPDVIIGTGANWAEANPATTAVLFGYEADDKMVQERLGNLAARKGWEELKAVKNGNFRSIYHQFYNSPYHFVALQTFAKWFYPDEFKDVEPEKTFTELHDRFLPIDYSGVFWGTLEK